MSTITRRKTRTDAKLERLNEAQRERLHFWFEENRTYAEIVRLLREEFGLSVGKSTVGAYWRRHMLPEQEQDEAEIVAGFAARPAADFDAATLNEVKLLAWLAVARPDPDVNLAVKLLAIVDKVGRHALAIERLALEKRKVALRESAVAQRKVGAERRAAAEGQGAAQCEASPVVPAILLCEEQNLPRFPGYSEVVRTETETELPANYANAEAGLETTKDTKGHEKGEGSESAEVVGRGDCAEVAAKAQRSEGRSEGAAEVTNLAALEAGPALLVPFSSAHALDEPQAEVA